MIFFKMNVLVISYFFPPFNRVGGRRWAKHTKYLNRIGLNTYVLTGEFTNTSSAWDDDIEEYKEKITRVNRVEKSKPFFKTKLPINFIEKLKWKTSLISWRVNKNFLKGNFNDISINCSDSFFASADELIKKNKIDIVLLSVGPFSYSKIILQLKAIHPNVKFVIDYRDKWEDGFLDLNEQQIKFETQQQINILNNVDLVLTVNENISENIKRINSRVKVYTLPHCVDDDFFNLKVQNENKSAPKKEKFIYGGELYNGLETEVKTFIDFFERYKSKVKKNCEATFYLSYPTYSNLLNGDGIKVSELLTKEHYIIQLKESDFILLFRPNWSAEAFSSKFFEILCLRKPILYFGNEGAVSEFLIKNKLGYHIRSQNLNESIEEILNNKETKHIPNLSYDLSKHTFEHHTVLLAEQLALLVNKN